MKKKILLFIIIQQMLLSCFVFTASSALAQVKEPSPVTSPTVTMSRVGDQGIYGISGLIQKFGGWLLLIAGALAVVMIVLGGLRYMASMGNSQQAEGAKKTILYAVIGLIVVVLSAFIAKLVIFFFTSSAQPQPVKDIAAKIKSGEIKGEISQCQYNGQTVFNAPIPFQGPDSYSSALHNIKGEIICYTSGGFTGKGDLSKCPGFDPSKCSVQ